MTDGLRELTGKGQRTRLRIIETASRLILANGVARTTLDEVGAAAAVGRSQLYHYFTNKADLVDAVIAHQTGAILDPGGPHLAPLDSWPAWQRWRDEIVAFQAHGGCVGGCPLGSLASELSDTSETARRALVAGFDRWEAVFRAGIDAMRTRGLLTADADPAALASAVLACLQGGLLMCQVRHDPAPLEAALDAAIGRLRQFRRD